MSTFWIVFAIVMGLLALAVVILLALFLIVFYVPPRTKRWLNGYHTPPGKLYDDYREEMVNCIKEIRNMPFLKRCRFLFACTLRTLGFIERRHFFSFMRCPYHVYQSGRDLRFACLHNTQERPSCSQPDPIGIRSARFAWRPHFPQNGKMRSLAT